MGIQFRRSRSLQFPPDARRQLPRASDPRGLHAVSLGVVPARCGPEQTGHGRPRSGAGNGVHHRDRCRGRGRDCWRHAQGDRRREADHRTAPKRQEPGTAGPPCARSRDGPGIQLPEPERRSGSQRCPRGLEQLHAGRRGQQRPPAKRRRDHAESRRAGRIQRADEQLQRGVRPQHGSDCQCRDEVRNQRVPRVGLRIRAQRHSRRPEFLRPGEGKAPAQPVRGHVRGAGRTESNVLLRRVRGSQATPSGHVFRPVRPDGCRAVRGFLVDWPEAERSVERRAVPECLDPGHAVGPCLGQLPERADSRPERTGREAHLQPSHQLRQRPVHRPGRPPGKQQAADQRQAAHAVQQRVQDCGIAQAGRGYRFHQQEHPRAAHLDGKPFPACDCAVHVQPNRDRPRSASHHRRERSGGLLPEPRIEREPRCAREPDRARAALPRQGQRVLEPGAGEPGANRSQDLAGTL